MSTVPTPAEGWTDTPIVVAATDALAAFAVDNLPRELASLLLAGWRHYPSLTGREVAAILLQYRLEDAPPESWLSDERLTARLAGRDAG